MLKEKICTLLKVSAVIDNVLPSAAQDVGHKS